MRIRSLDIHRMVFDFKLWLIIPLLGSTVVLRSQNLESSVDSLLLVHIKKELIPGAVVQIKKGNRIILSKAYGYAQTFHGKGEKLSTPIQMTTDHLFDIASLTKVVGTTTAIMILYDRDSLNLDDPVSRFIPEFSHGSKSTITIRHLLQHSSGMYEWYPLYYKAEGRQNVYDLIHDLPIPYPVGEKRRYSDLGFTLLGEIIERISRVSLEIFLEENLFFPLRMHNTFYNPNSKKSNLKIAATSTGNPYEKRMVYDPELGFQFIDIDPKSWNKWRDYVLVGEVNDGNTWYGGRGVSGAAGLFSTITDLQKIIDMLMYQGKVGHKQFLSEKVIEEFLSIDQYGNGLGWIMDIQSSFMSGVPRNSFGHTGFTGTSIVVIPDRGLSVIILINRQHSGLIDGQSYFNVNPIRQKILSMCLR